MEAGWGLFCQDVGAVGGKGARETAFLHLELLAVDLVAVCAVGQSGGEIDKIGKTADIHHSRAFLATVHQPYLTVFGELQVFLLPAHGVTEFVDGRNFRVLELVVATCAQHIIAEIIVACRAGGT